MEEQTKPVSTSVDRRKKRYSSSGRAVVTASFNNTSITITDLSGKTVCSSSCGRMGFKGTRKSTSYAAEKAAEDAAKRAINLGVNEVSVFVKGPGPGRIGAVKMLRTAGLRVRSIADTTPLPHNGCRPKNRRKV